MGFGLWRNERVKNPRLRTLARLRIIYSVAVPEPSCPLPCRNGGGLGWGRLLNASHHRPKERRGRFLTCPISSPSWLPEQSMCRVDEPGLSHWTLADRRRAGWKPAPTDGARSSVLLINGVLQPSCPFPLAKGKGLLSKRRKGVPVDRDALPSF